MVLLPLSDYTALIMNTFVVSVFIIIIFFSSGSSYHPPQFGSACECVPAIHPATAVRQRRLLHSGLCSCLHRTGYCQKLSQVHTRTHTHTPKQNDILYDDEKINDAETGSL